MGGVFKIRDSSSYWGGLNPPMLGFQSEILLYKFRVFSSLFIKCDQEETYSKVQYALDNYIYPRPYCFFRTLSSSSAIPSPPLGSYCFHKAPEMINLKRAALVVLLGFFSILISVPLIYLFFVMYMLTVYGIRVSLF